MTAEIQELAVKLHDMIDSGVLQLGPDMLSVLMQLNQLGFQLDDGDYVVFEVPELAMALDLATKRADDE